MAEGDMVKSLSNGRTSIGPEEKSVITGAFQLVADWLLRDDGFADVIVEEAALDLEDGAAVSRTTYSDLFALIGTTYGAGNGSTTFNVPNLKGRVPVGLDGSQTEFDALGEAGGEKAHVLTIGEMPAHTHPPDGQQPVRLGLAARRCGHRIPGDRLHRRRRRARQPAAVPHDQLVVKT
jgi:hypothetical protein